MSYYDTSEGFEFARKGAKGAVKARLRLWADVVSFTLQYALVLGAGFFLVMGSVFGLLLVLEHGLGPKVVPVLLWVVSGVALGVPAFLIGLRKARDRAAGRARGGFFADL